MNDWDWQYLDFEICSSLNFDVLSEPEQRKVLKRLSLDLDLQKALLIKDNDYWARRCEQKWKISNVTEYGASFRRMYLERLLEEKIENFVPNQSEIGEVDELIEIVKGDVIRVRKEVLFLTFYKPLFNIISLKKLWNKTQPAITTRTTSERTKR